MGSRAICRALSEPGPGGNIRCPLMGRAGGSLLWGQSVTYAVPRPRGPVRPSATLCGSQERVARSGHSPPCKPGATMKLRRPRVPAPVPAGYLRRSSGRRREGQCTVHGGGLAALPVLAPPSRLSCSCSLYPGDARRLLPSPENAARRGITTWRAQGPIYWNFKDSKTEEGLPPPEIASSSLPSGLRGGDKALSPQGPQRAALQGGGGVGEGEP